MWEPGSPLEGVQALVRQGRATEAEAGLAALVETPRAAGALLRGAIAARQGDLEAALAETGRAVQLALDDGEALTALAVVQLALGHPGFARAPAERAARLAPDFSPGHAALAALSQRNLDMEAALAALRAAAVAAALHAGLRADTPGFRAVAAELGQRLAKTGREEAARLFREIGES